jgi:hypothetical protein
MHNVTVFWLVQVIVRHFTFDDFSGSRKINNIIKGLTGMWACSIV